MENILKPEVQEILDKALFKDALIRKALLRKKILKHTLQLSISIIGATILIYKEGWLFLLGLTIFMWGNNLMISNKKELK